MVLGMLCEPTKAYLVYQLLQLVVLAVLVSVKDAVKALEIVENYFGIAIGVVLLQVLCHFKLNDLAWLALALCVAFGLYADMYLHKHDTLVKKAVRKVSSNK
jgi:EamA domain-containing membrane protein RarD